MNFENINEKLREYVEKNVFPKYDRFYSHNMIHINNVINNCIILARYYNLDENMSYTIASYHDLGLSIDRENHEYESGKILENDKVLRRYFNEEQIQIMREAVEDHRGSRKERPRNIYGEILSDSDRDFDINLLAKRQLATSIKNYSEMKTFEEHFERCYSYILQRLNNVGHFNLWTENPILIERRTKFEKEFLNKEYAYKVYKKEWERISQDGTIEKIKNYYLDY